MDPRGVEKWDGTVCDIAKNQQQLRTSQNHTVDTLLLSQAINDCQEPLACLGPNDPFDQFAHVLVVNVGLLVGLGHNQRDSSSVKYAGIEFPLHGEASAQQDGSFQTLDFGRITSGFHNAD